MQMASKSGKIEFSEGERVLCYEPDLTKAKVLYDSKVLDVVITKDSKGKRTIEYLIHFQGWNSSWDRCVLEEFVLKDTPENRQLQRDLAEQSQLHLGAYLYRKERKKQNRKVDEARPLNTNTRLSEDGSVSSVTQTIDTEYDCIVSSSEADSVCEDEIIPIELTNYLRSILEHDYYLINNKNKLMKLPAEPHVVTILENYWKYYCSNMLCELGRKPSRRLNEPLLKVQPDDMKKNLNLCKEMLDGLRIYFDFTLSNILLYKREKEQIEVSYAKSIPRVLKQERVTGSSAETPNLSHLPNVIVHNVFDNHNHIAMHARRRSLRSHTKATEVLVTNGFTKDPPTKNVLAKAPQPKTSPTNTEVTLESLGKIISWQLLPNYVYNQHPLPPSLVYGATHLLRLFVKLPELLNATGIMEKKYKALQEQLQGFLSYLDGNKELYGDRFYEDSV